MTKEMRDIVEKLEETYGADGCQHCPFEGHCHEDGLHWSCIVWELSMGEDL